MQERNLTEAEFDREFTLVEFPDGGQVTNDQKLMQSYPANRVWTLVDTDEGTALVSGFAVVNHIGWQVTVEPHDAENYEITVEMPDENDEPYDPEYDEPILHD